MFENVIDDAAIDKLDAETLESILTILEKAGY
jgi:hypothetical protein